VSVFRCLLMKADRPTLNISNTQCLGQPIRNARYFGGESAASRGSFPSTTATPVATDELVAMSPRPSARTTARLRGLTSCRRCRHRRHRHHRHQHHHLCPLRSARDSLLLCFGPAPITPSLSRAEDGRGSRRRARLGLLILCRQWARVRPRT
jgi:hypothetical protein